VTVLADGRRALSAASDKTLRLWDLETGAQLRRFEGHEGTVSSVRVLTGGRHALSAASDKTLRLWDLNIGAELARLTFDALTRALAWSPKRRRVVVGDARGRVHVIQLME
jgi:WD40 repeat protein